MRIWPRFGRLRASRTVWQSPGGYLRKWGDRGGAGHGPTVTRRVFAEMGSCGGAAHGLTVTRRVFAEMAPAVEWGQARGPSPPRFGRPADDFAPPGGGLFFRFTVVEAGFECFVAAGLAPDLAADVELVPCPVSLTPRR